MYRNCINCFAALGEDGVCPRCGFENAAYTPGQHHLPPETILHGRYLVGRAMGEGGFGITYAGYDMVLDRKVAVKEYFPSGAVWRDPEKSLNVTCYTSQNHRETFEVGRQKCMREAKSLAKLDDIPAIVRILDFFSDNNTAYIIMEFVEGSTLKDYVSRLPQKLTLPDVLDLLRPVTDALETVHARGFVHRDISPDNIMVTQSGTAKLLDFGAVKSVSAGGSATENPVVKRGFSPMELYSTTGLIGTWTDVYALAATIAYLLTGAVPDEPTDRLMDDRLPEKLDGTCTEAQKAALLHALAIQPKQRQQSVAELVRDLTDAPEPEPEPKPEPTGSSKEPQAFVPAFVQLVKDSASRSETLQRVGSRLQPKPSDDQSSDDAQESDAKVTHYLNKTAPVTLAVLASALLLISLGFVLLHKSDMFIFLIYGLIYLPSVILAVINAGKGWFLYRAKKSRSVLAYALSLSIPTLLYQILWIGIPLLSSQEISPLVFVLIVLSAVVCGWVFYANNRKEKMVRLAWFCSGAAVISFILLFIAF